MSVRIIITASGGGHTGYAVALAQRLYRKAELLFIIPQGDYWSKLKVKNYGKIVEIPKPRGPKDSFIKLLIRMPKAFFKSISKIPKSFDILISSGSNHSVPVAIAAWLKGLRIYNIESSVRFVKPSLSTKWLKPISYITVLQWDEQKRIHPDGKVYGPLYELPKYEIRDKGYILVTGGTYGHKLLFDTVSELDLEKVVLQTGRISPEPYKRKHPEWTIFKFDPDFGKWIAGASVVVSHLGKTVIDAALTYRKPVVITLNPEWRLTAGWHDARILARKLNAILLERLTPENLLEAISKAKKRRPPLYPDGAEKLAKELLEL